MLASADRVDGQGRDDFGKGLKLFDLEQRNILAGQAWAAEHVRADRALAKLASDYAANGAQILAGRQTLPARRAWLEAAVEAARWLGDPRIESGHLGQLGSAFRHYGQPQRAIEYYQQCLRMARDANDRTGEGMALEKIGLAYADLKEPWQAVDYYERSLAIARELGQLADEARTSWNLGLAYRELDDLSAAIAAMQVCVDYERSIGHPNADTDAAEVEATRALLARRFSH
jgi:tetratricopeptide (TPR) repeat protein